MFLAKSRVVIEGEGVQPDGKIRPWKVLENSMDTGMKVDYTPRSHL